MPPVSQQVGSARIVGGGSGLADDGTPITILVIEANGTRGPLGFPTADFAQVFAGICKAGFDVEDEPEPAPRILKARLYVPGQG